MVISIEDKIVNCVKEAYQNKENRIIDSKYIGFFLDKKSRYNNEMNEDDFQHLNLFHAVEGGTITVEDDFFAGFSADVYTFQLGRDELVWAAENEEELEAVDYEAFERGEVDMPSIVYKDVNVCLVTGNHEGSMVVTMLVIPDEILKANNYKIGGYR